MKMNAETAGWGRRYQTALSRYLKQGSAASLLPALRLGRQAVALGLETLDIALFHEQAQISPVSPGGPSVPQQSRCERAKDFFAETLVPVEKTHSAALKAAVRVDQLTRALHQRTVEASASTRHLARNITLREAAEASLRKSGKACTQLVQESNSLQTRLRNQTGKILSTQEEERQKTSLQLQDEIAQTLLAINIGLLALKTSAKANTEKLEKEIASTQRLVRESVKRINRFAHEFAIQHKN